MCSNGFRNHGAESGSLFQSKGRGHHPDFRNTEGWKAVHKEKDIPFVTWKWSKFPRAMTSLWLMRSPRIVFIQIRR